MQELGLSSCDARIPKYQREGPRIRVTLCVHSAVKPSWVRAVSSYYYYLAELTLLKTESLLVSTSDYKTKRDLEPERKTNTQR